MTIQTLYKTESYGGYDNHFYLNIEVESGDRVLDDADRLACYPHIQAIERLIRGRTYALKPETQAAVVEEKTKLLEVFGDEKIWVQPVENRYHGDSPHGMLFPWFDVTTRYGIFLIGWRKRVVHLDWSRTLIKKDAETLFPTEDVTKMACMIHAWGYGKLKQYMDVLLQEGAKS
jgi:hypothetical protein